MSSSAAASSATDELKQFLSTPTSTTDSNHGTGINQTTTTNNNNNNVAAIAHAALQTLRDSGDTRFLFLRTILEQTTMTSIMLLYHQNQNQHAASSSILTPQVEELLFHCITGCRHVILSKWNNFSIPFKRSVRDYFMILGINSKLMSTPAAAAGGTTATTTTTTQPIFSKTIRSALYNASASFWKREWNDDEHQQATMTKTVPPSPEEQSLMENILSALSSLQLIPSTVIGNNNPQHHHQQQQVMISSKSDLFTYLDVLLSYPSMSPESLSSLSGNGNGNGSNNANTTYALVAAEAAASYLNIFIGEFAGKSSSNYNMPLEFHKRAHATFEASATTTTTTAQQQQQGGGGGWLDRTLQISMKALSQVVSVMTSTANQQQQQQPPSPLNDLALSVVQLTVDVIGWEFGAGAWDSTGMSAASSSGLAAGGISTGKSLLRPPQAWREILMQPEFVKAVFHVHAIVMYSSSNGNINNKIIQNQQKLGHAIRQLLLLLTSLSGPMFQSRDERKTYCSFLLEGILQLVHSSSTNLTNSINDQQQQYDEDHSELLDTLSLISRLIVNYKLSILVELLPLMGNLFQAVASIGTHILQANVRECESVRGDLESMENREWREEALVLLLEGIVLLCDDPWLLYSGSEASRQSARSALASTLGPLYVEFVNCRTRMGQLEEEYFTANEAELDEVREEIFAVDLDEEMTSLANVGRLDLASSLSCLSTIFLHKLVPRLQALWDGTTVGDVTPEAAGLLEESRLVVMYIGHLLTDDNAGETPVIPDSIIIACQGNSVEGTTNSNNNNNNAVVVTNAIVSAVQNLQQFAQFQASKIASHPGDPRLSPLLAKSFLWFLNRWSPAYILPVDYGASSKLPSGIVQAWTSTDTVQESINFICTLCLHYQCYWPHERQVQDNAVLVLLSLAKRCSKMRLALVSSPSFRQLITYHCLTCGIRHSASPAEFESTIRDKVATMTSTTATHSSNNNNNTTTSATADINVNMLRGYQRLPYDIKSKILTSLLVGCSEHGDELSNSLLNDCLKAIHDAFSSLIHVLATKQASPDNVDAKEMTSLCVELYDGVARSGDMVAAERVPKFLTPSLQHLSGLMAYYATDLSICETLLRLFRDYAEQFIAVLDPPSCLALFQSSADLLKSYSTVHCNVSTRVILHAAEEEQNYNDVLCAIQLLIQLGTKDFIDIGDSRIDSSQVTDMIFFGLQQILPLMTKGLLQFPTLCTQYFSLVGFMMETYPSKVAVLPYDLFDALLESLLYGMSHHDVSVAKCSLQGLSGIAREHLQSNRVLLSNHLAHNPTLFDKCYQRILLEVIFQNNIWDRMEATSMALLPLAAIDLNRFATIVHGITSTVMTSITEHQKQRLSNAFERLLKPDILSKINATGYEGRQNRTVFKRDFELFCHDIHSFLLMK